MFFKGGFKIIKKDVKNKIVFTLIFTLVLNVLGIIDVSKTVNADSRPKIEGVELVETEPVVGEYPTFEIISKDSDLVQYSLYSYSESKGEWEEISDGYTEPVDGNEKYTLKSTKALEDGENTFRVWVKKAESDPINEEGYDDFKEVNITAKEDVKPLIKENNISLYSSALPNIKSANIDLDKQKVGTYPELKVSSIGEGKVQYRVYLYSPSKKGWEDVTGGYTAAVDAKATTVVKLNKPLHDGNNSFSVWVKRAGQNPDKKEGYDNFVSYSINANGSSNLPEIKSAIIDTSEQKVGVKPTLNITSTGSEKVEYRVYLYSPTKKAWEDVTGGYTSAKDPSSTTSLQLNAPLHSGENSFSVWVKRAGKDPSKKEGYDNFISYRVNVPGSETPENPLALPEIKSANIDISEQKVGIKPTLNVTSTGSENVEYRVYLYSPTKKGWEDVTGGYTSAKNPSSTTSLKLNSPLHSGENSFSVWVKRAGKSPADKAGYDNFMSYKINVTEKSNAIAQITNVSFDSSQIKLGGKPSITLKSNSDVSVEYRVYLYSQVKNIWEDVTGGYTNALSPESATIKTTGELQPGRNTYSIWVKRAGYSPNDPAGYDSYVHEVVNVDIASSKAAKITSASVNTAKIAIGTRPEVRVTASAGDSSNVSYKTFLYSNSKKQWVEASSYTTPTKSGQEVTITLSTPLESGNNKILVWAKRASLDGDVYEDIRELSIDAVKPAPLKKTIVVDPGHGGKDPGTTSPIDGTQEKVIALIVGKKLGALLSNAGYEVLYTRTDNNDVPWDSSNQNNSLRYRYTYANDNKADVFVSIHCNQTAGGYGTETWYSKQNPNKDKALASAIQSEVIKATGMRNRGIKNNLNFQVVNNTKMAASLVELGFIDSASDLAKLKSPVYQDKFAQGIFNGIKIYLGNK